MRRIALFLAAASLATGPVFADAPKIDRTIGKEPAYQTKSPKYCLLAFGAEGKDRVWLVLDGDMLYVDRNGDGGLTKPGNKIAAEKRQGGDSEVDGYSFNVGEVTVGGRTHKGLAVYLNPLRRYVDGSLGSRADVKAALAKDPGALAASLSIDVDVPGLKGGGLGGRARFRAGLIDLSGVFQFADRAADAPVVRLGAPLEITFYAELPTLRVGRPTDLCLVVGSPGIGPGTFAMLDYAGTIPLEAKPMAETVFTPANPGATLLRDKWVIADRC